MQYFGEKVIEYSVSSSTPDESPNFSSPKDVSHHGEFQQTGAPLMLYSKAQSYGMFVKCPLFL